jgi:hypothetical protein
MAVWQFDLYFIPIGSAPPDINSDEWDSPVISRAHARSVQEYLAHYFGQPWMMLEDWIVFGPENGNRVDVLFGERHADASIFVRCDLRNEAPQFFQLVAELARKVGCEFFCSDNAQLISADLQDLALAANARRGSLSKAGIGN